MSKLAKISIRSRVMEIQRQFYLNELVRKQRNGFVKVITSHAPAPLYDEHGILTMSIYDFLLNPNSLDF